MSIKRLYTATLRSGKKDNKSVLQLVLFKWKDQYGISDSNSLSKDLTVEAIKKYPYRFTWYDDVISGLLEFRKCLALMRSKLNDPRAKNLKLNLYLEKTKLITKIAGYNWEGQNE